MEKVLKQPVVILNRPGASGAIGMAAAAHADPDGYTILHTLVSYNTIPLADELYNRKPAYTREQFAPLALIAADAPVLVVGAQQPWKTLDALIADAKKRPNEIVFSSPGLYAPGHLPMEMFAHAAGIRLRHVPMVGAAGATTAVLGGHAALWASPASVAAPHIEAGRMRIFATWGAQRHPYFKDVPTFKELGYNIENYTWIGQFAPAKVPEAVRAVLVSAVRKGVEDAAFRTTMDKLKTPITFKEGAEFQKFLDEDARASAAVINRIGRIDKKAK
jgi:tripartite-type tricarboxylate transporter receptor subunit TctC